MSYCSHPHCSTPIIKPLSKAHSFLCKKSDKYHKWHHNPHHKKVHLGVLATSITGFTILMFSLFGFPHFGKAAESFRANFDSGSLNADYSVGTGTASNDGTGASITSPGYNSSTGAVTVSAGQTLKYPVPNNLDNAKGEIEMKFQLPYDLKGDQSKRLMNNPWGISYDAATGYIYTADTNNNRVIKTKIDGTGWVDYGKWGVNAGQLKTPSGLFYDPASDNLYIADSGNNRIVKTKMDGTGWATVGGVTNPTGVWYDTASQFLYIAETGNHRIVKMKFDGTSRTNLGGTASGSGVNQFNTPQGITYDAASDYIFVADSSNARAVKTKIDGTGWTTLSTASRPRDVKYDAANDFIYVSQYVNSWDTGYILKTKIDGTSQTNLSTGGYSTPKGLFYDPGTGNIYCARGMDNGGNSYLFKTQIDGTGQASYGHYGNSLGFLNPSAVSYDQSTGNLYVLDQTASVVIRTKWDLSNYSSIRPTDLGAYAGVDSSGPIFYDPSSQSIYASTAGVSCAGRIYKMGWSGSGLASNYEGNCAGTGGIYYDSGADFVYRTLNWGNAGTIVKSKINGTSSSTFGTYGTGTNQFKQPYGVVYDAASGYLYVADYGNHRIVKTKMDGTGWATLGGLSSGSGVSQFNAPQGIFYDPATDYIYVSDTGNNRMVKTKIDGTGWTAYGTGGSGVGQFSSPRHLSVDTSTETIYVADYNNRRIVKTKIDGTGWGTLSGDTTKNLLKTSGSNPMSLTASAVDGRFKFTTANGLIPYLLQSDPQANLPAGSWHTIKVAYNNSSGIVTMLLDGTQIASQTFPVWAAPDIGGNFYVGSDPVAANSSYALSAPIDEIKLTSIASDMIAPVNPPNLSVLNQSGGTEIANQNSGSGNWYKYPSPIFNWSGSTDNDSGVKDYWVYWGTSNSADPQTQGTAQTGTTYAPANLVSGQTYYLKIKTRDNAYNVSAVQNTFTYKFENEAPTNSPFVAVNPATYTSQNHYTFFWQDDAVDSGGSNLTGYQYKLNDGAWSSVITPNPCDGTKKCQLVLDDIAQPDRNYFRLRTIDGASNTSNELMTNFYFGQEYPSKPLGLIARYKLAGDPDGQNCSSYNASTDSERATINSFCFSWSMPERFKDGIKQYYYSINNTPTIGSPKTTALTSLPFAPYATVQGPNILYVVAEDSIGKDLTSCGKDGSDSCAQVTFYVNTPNPAKPESVEVFDTSNKDLQKFRTSINWDEPLISVTGFKEYQIYRCDLSLSGDQCADENNDFASIGTTSGTAFADSRLESKEYRYLVKAKDNAEKYSIGSNIVAVTPTGKFTKPPIIKEDSLKVDSKAFSATFKWSTQDADPKVVHRSSSFVEYGLGKDKVGKENGGETIGQLDKVDDHTVTLKGLKPDQTKYFYRVVWVDQDGNEGSTEVNDGSFFMTQDRPIASEIKVPDQNITLTTASITYKTNYPVTTEIIYGKSKELSGSTTGNKTDFATNHIINLSSLDHSTKYYFKIMGNDQDGNTLDLGTIGEFDTLTMPRITDKGVQMDQDKESPTTAYRFTWETNVPTTSVIYYQDNKGKKLSQSNADYVTQHSLEVANLADMSTYTFEVGGTDNHGNAVEKPFQSEVTTPLDSRPPKVSNMTVEIKSSGFGASQKAQIVVTWQTDEPGTSQVEYAQGISGKEYSFKSKEDSAISTSHAVIISELEPSKIYHLRAVSRDAAGNAGFSEDTTTITGKSQSSVIEIIMTSLTRSLGWMFRMFGTGTGTAGTGK